MTQINTQRIRKCDANTLRTVITVSKTSNFCAILRSNSAVELPNRLLQVMRAYVVLKTTPLKTLESTVVDKTTNLKLIYLKFRVIDYYAMETVTHRMT